MILLTTSRRPTGRIRTFCRDVKRFIPNVVRINRGKLNLDGVAEKALEFEADRVIIVNRWKGGPGKIEFFRTAPTGLTPVPPLIYVAGIRLQREFETKIKPVKSFKVTISSEISSQVTKIAECLSDFLNVPMSPMNQAVSKHQVSMHVSLNASRQTQITFMLLPEMVETGPRITISHVVWDIGK